MIEEMPFGKYKGIRFDAIPEHYLLWLLAESESLSESLRYYLGRNANVSVEDIMKKLKQV